MATTPSRPAPSNRSNQSAASARSGVAGVRWTGGVALAEHRLEPGPPLALRTPRAGPRRRARAGPRRRTTPAISAASIRTRDAAGWMRSSSASNWSAPSPAITTSPSSTQRSGSWRLERLGELGEVAVERLEVAALDVDLVAVAEHDRPEAVPLGLEQPAVALGQAVAGLGEHRLDGWLERESHGPHDTAPGSPRDRRCGTTRTAHGSTAHDPARGEPGAPRGASGRRRGVLRTRGDVRPCDVPTCGTRPAGDRAARSVRSGPGRARWLAACSGSSSSTLSTVGAPIGDGDAAATPLPPRHRRRRRPAPAGSARPGGLGDGSRPRRPRDDLKIVYTGSLQLVVDDLDGRARQGEGRRSSRPAATSARRRSRTTATGPSRRSRTASRPPAGTTRSATSAGLATKVVAEQTQATEVGGQIVDLEARLRNLRASEASLQGIAAGHGQGQRPARGRGAADRRPRPDRAARRPAGAARGPGRLRHARDDLRARGRPGPGAGARAGTRRTDVDGAFATLIGAGQAIVSGAIWFAIVWLPVIAGRVVPRSRCVVRRFVPSRRPAGLAGRSRAGATAGGS